MADNEIYYNYNNLEQCYNQLGIKESNLYLRWVKDIINTKVCMFEYENLPKGLTSEIVEKALMFNNHLCLWKAPDGIITLCKYRFGGMYDLYWKPVNVNLMTISGQPLSYNVPYEDIVIIRDNPMDIIPFLTLNSYIAKIIEQEKTLETLVRLVRFPTILTGDKEQTGQLKTLLKKNIECEGFIIGNKGLKDHWEQFDIQMPCKLIEAYEIMEKYRNLAIGSMGIYTVDEKRERIVTAEVQATNDYVDFVYEGMARERKRAWKEANEKWGGNTIVHELYIENKRDEIKMIGEETSAVEEAKADAEIRVNETAPKPTGFGGND